MSALDNLVRAGGGRRFAIALLAIACAMLARAYGWIDGAQLVDVLTKAVGLYGAANVGGRLAEAVRTAIAAALANKQTGGPA